jgi:serine/threonine protein kinase
MGRASATQRKTIQREAHAVVLAARPVRRPDMHSEPSMTSRPQPSSTAAPKPPAGSPSRRESELLRGADALPPGSVLGEFEIECVLSENARGIVYLAIDPVLQRRVAIREYLPMAWATRGQGAQVVLRSPAKLAEFVHGQRAFINEAQALVRFEHPSLMRVFRCWEANRTAYVATPCYEGKTLQQVRDEMTQPPSEAWLRALLEPLLEALQLLHGASVYHLNLTPEHVLLLPDGKPVLFDLGVRADEGRLGADKSLLNPVYAPIEQYAETEQLRVGPWTDLYSLAAMVYFCVSGRAPLPATARAVGDAQVSLTDLVNRLGQQYVGPRYSRTFLDAFDWALAVRPQDRPQRVSQLRQVLGGLAAAASTTTPAVAAQPEAPAWRGTPETPVPEMAPEFEPTAAKQEPSFSDSQKWFVPPAKPAQQPPSVGAAAAPAPPLSPRELGERLHATVKSATTAAAFERAQRPPEPRLGGLGGAPGAPAAPDFEASIQQALHSAMSSIEEDERHNSRFGDAQPSTFGLDSPGLAAGGTAGRPAAGAAGLFGPEGAYERPRWRRRTPWYRRAGVRWGGSMVAIAMLAWLAATEWEGQRLSERVMDTMARTLRPAQEAQGPTISSQAPAVAAAPAAEEAAASAAAAAARSVAAADEAMAQTRALPVAPPAAAVADASAAKPAAADTVAGSGTTAAGTAAAAVPSEPAAPQDRSADEADKSSATKVASVKAGTGSKKREPGKATAAAPAEAPTPRAACGNRVQFSLYYCMQTQCRKPQFYKHPQCRTLRERDTVQD